MSAAGSSHGWRGSSSSAKASVIFIFPLPKPNAEADGSGDDAKGDDSNRNENEQCNTHALKLSPQEQVVAALGLLTLKPESSKPVL